MAEPSAAAMSLPTIRYSTYVEFFRDYWRGNGSGRNLPLEFPPPGRLPNSGKNAMKVFVFDLLAYGEQLDHLKVGSELPYPLSNRYFKADVAVRTYAEHLDAWEEMDRLGYDGARSGHSPESVVYSTETLGNTNHQLPEGASQH